MTLQPDKEGFKWLDKRNNRQELKTFLDIHGIDMEQTARIEFTRKGFTAWIYELDEDGNRFTIGEGPNKRAKVRVEEKTYLTDVPTFS